MTNRQDGCFYIATVWRCNNTLGVEEYYRAVERRWAYSPADFYENLLEESCDDEITIGVISVSKDQGTGNRN